MLADFTSWLFGLIKSLFGPLWDFLGDVLLNFLDLLVTGFVAVVAAIPVPDFLQSGLSSAWGGLDSGVVYVVSQCGFPQALALVGAGYAFRLVRKFATLFQW